MSIEIKLLNYLMNENFSILKTEKNNQWFLFQESDKSLIKLSLEKETNEIINDNRINVKNFKEAELRFDKLFGKLTYKSNSHILMVKSDDALPIELQSKLVSWWTTETNGA